MTERNEAENKAGEFHPWETELRDWLKVNLKEGSEV